MSKTSTPEEHFTKYARDNAVPADPTPTDLRAWGWKVARAAYLAGFRDAQKEKEN